MKYVKKFVLHLIRTLPNQIFHAHATKLATYGTMIILV